MTDVRDSLTKPRRTGMQTTGIVLIVIGLAIELYYFAGNFGWTRKTLDSPGLGLCLMFLGMALGRTRKQIYTPEQIAKQRRIAVWMVIVLTIITVAFILYMSSKGAR
jgi:hypothetical protein